MVTKREIEKKISEYNKLAEEYNAIRKKNIRLANKNTAEGRRAKKQIIDAYNRVARKGKEIARAAEKYQEGK